VIAQGDAAIPKMGRLTSFGFVDQMYGISRPLANQRLRRHAEHIVWCRRHHFAQLPPY
jgi:hypothetical protein